MKLVNEREQNFLSKLSVINYKYRTLDENNEQFNIFTALHKENDEVRLYSRFISVLLSPESRHKRNDLFLKLFLQILSVDDFDTSQCKVYPTEYDKSEYNEIDILIINRISRQAVIIENKIGAGDSNHEDRGQLEGYFNLIHSKENIPKENIRVYYLTPDRREPSDESLGKYKTLENLNGVTIDYEHEIQSWLNLCLQNCINHPYLRESILQFIKLINNMTNNDTNTQERLEIRNLIASSTENLKSAKLLIENFKHVKWHTVWDFWIELADALKSEGFEIHLQPTDDNITNTTHYETYKKSYSASNDYGLSFSTTKGLNIYIWNGVDDDWVYWGVNKAENSNDFMNQVENFMKNNPGYLKSSETSYWKYFDLKHEENIFFPDFSYDGTFNLIDEKYRTKIIEERLIPEIKKFLSHI